MRSCEEYQEMISRMLDGDLSGAKRDALAEHVRRCPDCAAVYVAFRSVSEHLGGELEEPPQRLHENVMAEVRRDALRKKNRAHSAHRRWHTALTVAACAVLLVAAGLSLPKIVGSKGSYAPEFQSAPAAVPAELPAAVENAEAAAGESVPYGVYPYAEPASDSMKVAQSDFDVQAAPNAIPTAPTPKPEAEEPAELHVRAAATVEDPLVLSKEESEALIELMSVEKVPLEREPDRELYLLYWRGGALKELRVLLVGDRAMYVIADGDSFCLFSVTADELLAQLGLAPEK